MTALDIVTDALMELNVVAQGETAQPGDASFGLRKLNRLLDNWAARKVYIYNVTFPTFTLVAGLSPHTIGPKAQITQSSSNRTVATYIAQNNFVNGQSATIPNSTNGLSGTGNVQSATAAKFSIPLIRAAVALAADTGNAVLAGSALPTFATPNMGQRPQRIEAASLILTDQTPNVEIPINIRDDDWWMNNRIKALESNVPTDLYYSTDFPNGGLYFWPVPNYNYGVRLEIWGSIPQFPALNYVFSLPPGYQDAITMNLARTMAGAFSAQWSQQQESSWVLAMKAVESNNAKSPRGVTGDAGMPGIGTHGGFNYYDSLPR